MAETLWAVAHLAGDVSDPANAVGPTDGVFTTDVGNTNWTSRWDIDTPARPLTGTQTVNVVLRKDADGGNDPTLNGITLYQNGTSIQTLVGSQAIGTDGVFTLTGTFDASVITDPAGVEVEISVAGSGGPGGSRRNLQIDSIEWAAQVTAIETITADVALPAARASMSGTAARKVVGTGFLAAGPASITAEGNQIYTGGGRLVSARASLSGVGTRIITGAGLLSANPARVSAIGFRTLNVVVGINAQRATLTGTAKRTVVGSGYMAAGEATIRAAKGVPGEGSLVAQRATLTGSASRVLKGTGFLTAGRAGLQAAGERVVTGAGALRAQPAATTGQALKIITAAGVLTAEPASLLGAGRTARTATGHLAAQRATVSAQALRTVKGSGSMQAGNAQVSLRAWIEYHEGAGAWAKQADAGDNWTEQASPSDSWTKIG